MKPILFLLATASFLVACGSSSPDESSPPPDDDDLDVPVKVDVQHAKTKSISTSPSEPTGH